MIKLVGIFALSHGIYYGCILIFQHCIKSRLHVLHTHCTALRSCEHWMDVTPCSGWAWLISYTCVPGIRPYGRGVQRPARRGQIINSCPYLIMNFNAIYHTIIIILNVDYNPFRVSLYCIIKDHYSKSSMIQTNILSVIRISYTNVIN